MQFLKQIDAWDEIMTQAKFTKSIVVANEDRKVEYALEFGDQIRLFGSSGYIVPRRILHNILVSRIEKRNIVMKKRVLSYIPGDRYVTVKCASGDLITCDILVGADGVYSAVRQTLYHELEAKGLLPPKDSEEVILSTVSLVGQTIPLDPEKFPIIKDEHCHFMRIIGDNKPYSWTYFTTKSGSINWTVTQYLSTEQQDDNRVFANTTFDFDQAMDMAYEVMNFPIITGGPGEPTMFDLLKKTTVRMKKVVLEEKLFKTWHHGRVVLLGNACHKMNPSGGSGATNAIHDAITLANYIVSLPHWSEQRDIEHRFKAYQDERMPWIKESYENGKVFKGMVEKSFKATMIRLCSKAVSGVVARNVMMKMGANRPQAAFLKYVPDTGTVPAAPQPSYAFAKEMLEAWALNDPLVDSTVVWAKAENVKNAKNDEKAPASIELVAQRPMDKELIKMARASSAHADIVKASAVMSALSAAKSAALAAAPKSALETFQDTPSKVKKPLDNVN
ncbi:hypothetical protein BGZ95_011086 [Linnemannia exigua]|uniref:FAD-binding domain-containing protein n=1 Tax=Linnemannia exigua TaxID=604196 RepID=A0AAD4DJX8_9FUNG|nr:hypothetical protein BGZ95_011086 [Linnemannia exigua]